MKNMENKQQTAVSEMFAQIKAARKDTQFWNDSMLVDWLLESEERFKQIEKEQIMQSIIEQAKEIHKQQIIKAYKEFVDTQLPNEVYEQYYNEEYGGNNEQQ